MCECGHSLEEHVQLYDGAKNVCTNVNWGPIRILLCECTEFKEKA